MVHWLGAGANLTQDPFSLSLGPPALPRWDHQPDRCQVLAQLEYFEGVKVGNAALRSEKGVFRVFNTPDIA